MLIVMRAGVPEPLIQEVLNHLKQRNIGCSVSTGNIRTVVRISADHPGIDVEEIGSWEGVERVVQVSTPFRLASRSSHPADTVVSVRGVDIGGNSLVVMAGPPLIESEDQITEAARLVRKGRAAFLLARVFRGTSQGTGDADSINSEILREVRRACDGVGLSTAVEICDSKHLEVAGDAADVYFVPGRASQNKALLLELGERGRTVILERSPSSSVREFVISAEQILSTGNQRVVLCESGIRSFSLPDHEVVDISAVPVLKDISHLPVLINPCRVYSQEDEIIPVARAAVAAGADGLVLDIRSSRDTYRAPGRPSLSPSAYLDLVREVEPIAGLLGKSV